MSPQLDPPPCPSSARGERTLTIEARSKSRLRATNRERQFEPHLAQGKIFRVSFNLEAKLAAHAEHALVGAKHVAVQVSQAFALGVADEVMHQRPAEPS